MKRQSRYRTGVVLTAMTALLIGTGWQCPDPNSPDANDTPEDVYPSYDVDGDYISNAVEQNPANSYLNLDYEVKNANPSIAVGMPDNGSITGALNLPDVGTGYVHNRGTDPLDGDDWGVLHMMEMIEGAGRDFFAYGNVPPRIQINDLSKGDASQQSFGGPFPPHASHQNGLDVDVRYLMKDGEEGPLNLGTPEGLEKYDVNKTYNMMALQLTYGIYQKIIVSPHLGYGFTGFADTVIVFDSSGNHDDHFHLRLKDPDGTSN